MDIAEISVTEFATSIVNTIAKKKKVSGMSIAAFVSGLAHDHPPCDFIVTGCIFCARNGNIFSKEQSTADHHNDVILKYKNKIMKIFGEMQQEIEVLIETGMQEDQDLEEMLMRELSL